MLESARVSIFMLAYSAARTLAIAKRIADRVKVLMCQANQGASKAHKALLRVSVGYHLPATTPMTHYRVQPESCSSKKVRNLQWRTYHNALGSPTLENTGPVMLYGAKALCLHLRFPVGVDRTDS
ncbi:hypothetical protein [Alcaligenes sp. Me129]|uniref:hypothetical protein n=1 Tax=Alcaligenes sp. Me129 TaxID=3392635 RepID=UPI003D1B0DD1